MFPGHLERNELGEIHCHHFISFQPCCQASETNVVHFQLGRYLVVLSSLTSKACHPLYTFWPCPHCERLCMSNLIQAVQITTIPMLLALIIPTDQVYLRDDRVHCFPNAGISQPCFGLALKLWCFHLDGNHSPQPLTHKIPWSAKTTK